MRQPFVCMTYNVLHFENIRTRQIDYDAFARVIREADADVVGLNEVYGASAAFADQTREVARRLGYESFFSEAFLDDGVNPFGNALLSRYPIRSAQTIPIPYPAVREGTEYYEPRAVLQAEIEGMTVLVTHFGLNPDEQENALQTVLPLLRAEKCILMGDFNVTPDAAVLRPIRARMQDADAFLPDGTMSFPSDIPRKKIDYIFTSRDLRIEEAQIPPVVVSDHRPFRVSLRYALSE